MTRPFICMNDEQLCEIYKDIEKSTAERRKVKSLVPYARIIRDNINDSGELFTLREGLEWVKEDFYMEVAKRFCRLIENQNRKSTEIYACDKSG